MMEKNAKEELRKLLNSQTSRLVPIQTHWVIVKEVNWKEKTMTATSVNSEIDFYEVILGLGSYFRKPKIGTSALIGIIENQQTLTFLIECEEFDETIFICEKTELIINKEGFIINQSNENLYKILSDYMNEFQNLTDEINKIKVAIGTSPNVTVITKIKQEVNSIEKRLNKVLK